MAILQEERYDAPQPEVEETDYGARYVKAATETPVAEPSSESVVGPSAEETPAEAAVVKRPKRAGRPRKKK